MAGDRVTWPATWGVNRLTTLPDGADHGRGHLGGVPGAPVGEGGVGHGLLDRGDVGAALAEGHLDVVAGVPGRVGEGLGVLGVELEPFGLAVHPALDLSRQVDTGQLAQAVLGGLVLDRGLPVLGGLGVEHVAQVVEEVVAGHGEGGGDVDVAEAPSPSLLWKMQVVLLYWQSGVLKVPES